jgi:hypothetical protein
MDFIGSLQPPGKGADDPNYGGTYLTRRRKLKLVRDWNTKFPAMPLCIDHADGVGADFKVPAEHVVGYVTGMLLDRNNNLLVTGHVFGDRPEATMLIQDMMINKRKWGLSGYTIFEYADKSKKRVVDDSKLFTHVGITDHPDMAEEGSYIFEFSTNPEAIPRIMREREVAAGGLANEQSLKMWGVHPTVARNVVTILEKNISDAGGEAPTPSSSHSSVSTADMSTTAPDAAVNNTKGTPVQDPNNKKNDPDAMEVDAAPGQQQQQQQQQGQDSTSKGNEEPPVNPIEGIWLGMQEAKKKMEGLSEMDRIDAIGRVLAGINQTLKEHKLALQELPREVRQLYTNWENQETAYNEAIITELIKQGTAANNNNAALVEKFKNERTPLEERRALADFVKAGKEQRENNQKTFEERLRREQEAREAEKRSYEEQLSRKRSLEDELAQLRAENERLTKRRPQSDTLRTPAAAAAPRGFDFLQSRPVSQQQQQQPQQPLADIGKKIATASGYNFYTPPSAAAFAEERFREHYSRDEIEGAHQREQQQNHAAETRSNMGFVTATGFRLMPSERTQFSDMPSGSWVNKFIVPGDKSSFAYGSNDPVFLDNFRAISEALESAGNAPRAPMMFAIPQKGDGREMVPTYEVKIH